MKKYFILFLLCCFVQLSSFAQVDDVKMDEMNTDVAVPSEPTDEDRKFERLTAARSTMGNVNYSNLNQFSKDTTFVTWYQGQLLDTIEVYRYRCNIEDTKKELVLIFSAQLNYSSKKAKSAAEELMNTLPDQGCSIVANKVRGEGGRLVFESTISSSKESYRGTFYFNEKGQLTRRVNYQTYNDNAWVKTGDFYFGYEKGKLATGLDSTFNYTWYSGKVELNRVTSKKYLPWGGKAFVSYDEYDRGVKTTKEPYYTQSEFDEKNRLIKQTSFNFSGDMTTSVKYHDDCIEVTTFLKNNLYSDGPHTYVFYPILKK